MLKDHYRKNIGKNKLSKTLKISKKVEIDDKNISLYLDFVL